MTSANINLNIRTTLGQQLGVPQVDQHDRYLGLPALIGKSKKVAFKAIQERVLQKLKGWKERMLSRAGKEILIKAIIQAIPTYVMCCFLLPKGICEDIEQKTARFWWGSGDGEQKTHWASWDLLTKSKEHGGIGFRSLYTFNLAMLSKQVWRLLLNPDSIAAQLLRAKYFPRTDILHANVGYQPSFLWRSLMASKEFVKNGSGWRVGNGTNINVLHDRWIGGPAPRRLKRTYYNIPETLTVNELINSESGQWDMERINQIFEREDADDILATHLSVRLPVDKRIWVHTKSGEFSVRSCYYLIKSTPSDSDVARPSTSYKNTAGNACGNSDFFQESNISVEGLYGHATDKIELVSTRIFTDTICHLCGKPLKLFHIYSFECTLSKGFGTLAVTNGS
ncbi:hypothetical protein DH2020_011898 [Rehmannia glutinosa]|uniref:Uncharacterized protein n=1 Tax=Rehmannia glutinosa TaxID=99300 RepID=A0ABR0XEL2_REHGL